MYTLDEFFDLEVQSQTKHQFYRGEIFAMAGGSIAHNTISGNLFAELRALLGQRDCVAKNSEVQVKVEATGFCTYPDAFVVCKPILHAATTMEVVLNPRVIIEVLSPSTEAFDRGTKSTNYRKIPSLREILLVNQHEPLVEQFVRQPDDTWLLQEVAGLDGEVEFRSLGCKLSMQQIYADVDFATAEFPETPPGEEAR
jgi:Uma2 family endonuclease